MVKSEKWIGNLVISKLERRLSDHQDRKNCGPESQIKQRNEMDLLVSFKSNKFRLKNNKKRILSYKNSLFLFLYTLNIGR